MKLRVWVLQNQNVFRVGYWTGDGLKFATDIDRAVWFVRRIDAERALYGWALIDAHPVEVEVRLSDGDEPRAAIGTPTGGLQPPTEALEG